MAREDIDPPDSSTRSVVVRWRRLTVIVCLSFAALGGAASWLVFSSNRLEPFVGRTGAVRLLTVDRPFPAEGRFPGDRYAGTRVCSECHPAEAALHSRSGHSATLLPAGRLALARQLDGKTVTDPENPEVAWSYQFRDGDLRIERTAVELRIEAQAVLCKLSVDLGVDAVTVDDQQQSRTEIIDQQARALADAGQQAPAAAAAWQALAGSIYGLDAHTQDTLAAQSDMESSAYQLGRGLAEVYWALDPLAECDPLTPACWTFLLGEHRCGELTRLMGRLSSYFNPYCSPAIAGTLRLWQSVAGDQQWRQDGQAYLYQQLRRWYELLILGQDPSTLIKPYALIRNWQTTLRVARALWVQIVTASVSLAMVIAVITLVADDSSSAFVKSLLGVLGTVGLSTAAFQARLKNTAQSLLTRIRQDAYTDLVAAQIAVAPDKPGARQPQKIVAQEVRKRTLTTVADAAAPSG